MSIEPCQICGGTGFIDAPPEPGEPPRPPHDPSQAGVYQRPEEMQKIPCPICSGSGTSAGL